MILAKVGPAFQPPAAGTDEILSGMVIVAVVVLLFSAALAAVHWYAARS